MMLSPRREGADHGLRRYLQVKGRRWRRALALDARGVSLQAAWLDGKRRMLRTPVRLSQFIAQHTGCRMELDVEYKHGERVLGFRVVVLPGREPSMTRLCTNLPRTPFFLDLVSRLSVPLESRAAV
jgi:hypothetical protein